ncbi:MAG: AAA family ATPase [Nitrospiraceae bacterium]|nr:MAG: AAA family ATPase [Nitrospiraceae bacterium]
MDFLEYYKLSEHPFSSSIDNRFYYKTTQHAEALLRLKYAVDTMKGLAVVVGEVGTGKSTLARRMLDELDPREYEAALLIVLHTSVTTDWIMKKIAMQLGIKDIGESKLEVMGQVARKLQAIHNSGLKTVILLDEVQMLKSKEIMEEFRGLLNMEVVEGKLLTLILFGLPELEEILAWDTPLKQRIAVKYRMNGFTEEITHEYIQHRLKIASCSDEIFTHEAVQAIHYYAGGVPRLINTICDNAIFEGFLVKANPIDRKVIESVAANLDLQPSEEELSHFG